MRVICRNVQRDVVKDLPTHVDFMRLRALKINLFIPLSFINEEECPGIKKRWRVVPSCVQKLNYGTAGDIPDSMTVDLDRFGIGDTITISSINAARRRKSHDRP